MSTAVYIFVMAIVTYIIRMVPFTFFNKKIKSRYIRSFLKYIP
ncbi:MAG: AzlD domain-containing protein, partial [Ruminococcus sp.]|nr:AzlD domain-containing protein [Ruminococcus sp.]